MNLSEIAVNELHQYGVSTQAINTLDDRDVIWLDQLLAMSPHEFLAIPNLGKKHLADVCEAVHRLIEENR